MTTVAYCSVKYVGLLLILTKSQITHESCCFVKFSARTQLDSRVVQKGRGRGRRGDAGTPGRDTTERHEGNERRGEDEGEIDERKKETVVFFVRAAVC